MQKQPNAMAYVLANQYVEKHDPRTAIVAKTENQIITEFANNFLNSVIPTEPHHDEYFFHPNPLTGVDIGLEIN